MDRLKTAEEALLELLQQGDDEQERYIGILKCKKCQTVFHWNRGMEDCPFCHKGLGDRA